MKRRPTILPAHRADTMTATVRSLTPSDTGAVEQVLGAYFLGGSVLHRALGIGPDRWQDSLSAELDHALAAECSVVAVSESGELLGCVIAWGDTSPAGNAIDIRDPITALLSQLRRGAPAPCNHTLHIDMAVVSPLAAGQGLYQAMRSAVHARGRLAGYTHVRGELSSAATQHVCTRRFGHRVLHEIPYADFQLNGGRPFSTITTPPTIQLVEGHL